MEIKPSTASVSIDYWALRSKVLDPPPCCVGTTGNVNGLGIVDLGDLSALVGYLTTGTPALSCAEEANVNGLGIVDLSDLSFLIVYLTTGTLVLPSCP